MDDRVKATKMFIERSRKRVDSVREEITKAQEAVLEAVSQLTTEEEALEDGLKRLRRMSCRFCKKVGRIECLCSSTQSQE